jgi:DNA modification methylase
MVTESSVKVLDQASGENWSLYRGDCVEVIRGIPSDSIHLSIYSPPFESLYTYSNSERDMGNNPNTETFWQHYKFLIAEQFRVAMPGRIVAVHCMNLPTTKQRDGYIGLRDFRGEIIREYEKAGFIFHSEVCIWKDPVTAMQRTKAIGLLWKQLKKDSCRSRQGVPDYLVVFQKPGTNPEPVSHTETEFPVRRWQQYASPIWDDIVADPCWFDINPSDTLQRESAREHKDERHICPLQLQVIERAVELWSNPGDVVLSPFAGIGSEGVVSLKMGRRFVGIELKGSYYAQAVANLELFVAKQRQESVDLFRWKDAKVEVENKELEAV